MFPEGLFFYQKGILVNKMRTTFPLLPAILNRCISQKHKTTLEHEHSFLNTQSEAFFDISTIRTA
jgi:hypothetical protein